MMTRPRRPVRVLESLRAVRETTNPYLTQLVRGLEADPDVQVILFSFRRGILGRFDVFHVHWPEQLMGGHSVAGRVVRRALTVLFLMRIALTRRRVVRTLHNLHRPEGLGRFDNALLAWLERLTTLEIHLNGQTPSRAAASVVIPHGHYSDWFASVAPVPSRARHVVYAGLVRRYKGLEQLVSAFSEVEDRRTTLHIAGKPTSDSLSRSLVAAAAADPRVTVDLQFHTDAQFATTIMTGEMVVLPYSHMHNSGTALAALSLGRPVLVPDNAVNRALAEEVGAPWVQLFEGTLSAQDIESAIQNIQNAGPRSAPDLSARDWRTGVTAHVRAFRSVAVGPR